MKNEETKQAISRLREMQQWRRGEGKWSDEAIGEVSREPMLHTPKQFGEDIDALIAFAEEKIRHAEDTWRRLKRHVKSKTKGGQMEASKMSDNLDTKTDAELSVIFAVEVAGWKKMEGREAIQSPDGKRMVASWCAGFNDFATDANAVLLWLEQCEGYNSHLIRVEGFKSVSHCVSVRINKSAVKSAGSITFARAACIALIRAKRAEREGKSHE